MTLPISQQKRSYANFTDDVNLVHTSLDKDKVARNGGYLAAQRTILLAASYRGEISACRYKDGSIWLHLRYGGHLGMIQSCSLLGTAKNLSHVVTKTGVTSSSSGTEAIFG